MRFYFLAALILGASAPVVGRTSPNSDLLISSGYTYTVSTYSLQARSTKGGDIIQHIQPFLSVAAGAASSRVHPQRPPHHTRPPLPPPPPPPTFKPMPHNQALPDAAEGSPDEQAALPVTTSAVPTNQKAGHDRWRVCWKVPDTGMETPNKMLYPPSYANAPLPGWTCEGQR